MAKVSTVLVLAAFAGHFWQTPMLDLTGVTLPDIPETEVRGRTGGAMGRIPLLSASITLADLEDRPYVLNEPFVFEGTLTNASQVPLTIPWSPYPVSASPESMYEAALTVVGKTGTGRSFVASTAAMFGSSEQPTSLKVLGPSQSVRIRADGQWRYVGDDTLTQFASPSPIDVQLVYRLRVGLAAEQSTPDSVRRSIVLGRPEGR